MLYTVCHVKRGGVNNSSNKKALILKAKKTSLALVTCSGGLNIDISYHLELSEIKIKL